MTTRLDRKVCLIKMHDLAGHVIRIEGNKRPYWFRVDRVESAHSPENRGHLVWVWGVALLSNGRPAKRRTPCDFIGPTHVVAVRS